MNVYFKLWGKIPVQCSQCEWSKQLGTPANTVDWTEVGPLKVSTVFLGLDHSFGGPRPILFETMIFGCDGAIDYCTRCSTYDEAERMHVAGIVAASDIVAAASAPVNAFFSQYPRSKEGDRPQ